MARAEEMEQIMKWLTEEGLAAESSAEAQLCFLWRTFLHARSCLDSVTKDLENNRLQHFAEMAEVRKSLEQIKIFTEQKDVLAQEIQDENEQLRKQLLHLVSLQDAQINEVAKMLYQQGLTELIHSTPSEQVAYLLVERASLLEMYQDPGELSCDGDPESRLMTQSETLNTSICPVEEKRSAGQPRHLEKECSRLERDVEEGTRRLAMAHNEIRRLKDELESAHCTQKAYEPELQSAQEEVELLRKEVEKLKQYDMVELRKAKELNDRLDLEIRALRNRVRSLDSEKSSLKKMVASQQEEVEKLKSALQRGETSLTGGVHANQDKDKEIKETGGAELIMSQIDLPEQSTGNTQQFNGNKKGHVESLQEVVNKLELAVWNFQGSYRVQTDQVIELTEESPIHPEEREALLYDNAECETLKRQICEAFNCMDEERRYYHGMKEKLMEKLCRAKQKLDNETTWRDKKINDLERELSFCYHSLKKEKEVVGCIAMENEKLLSERRKLLQRLSEEEDNMTNCKLTACLSKDRMEYLDKENKNLGNKILQMSHQIAILERRLQNLQTLHFAEELQQMSAHLQKCTPLSVQTARLMSSDSQDLLNPSCSRDTKQADLTSSPGCSASAGLPRTAELGYLNLTSTQSVSDESRPHAASISSENTTP